MATRARGRGGGSRRARRAAPVLAAALVAFAVGAIVGARHQTPAQRLARDFLTAWSHGDYARMWALTDDTTHTRVPVVDFAARYREAGETATVRRLVFARPRHSGGDVYSAAAAARTRLFGTVLGQVRLRVVVHGGSARVSWGPELLFPGLRPGEELRRETELPARAAILARDGTPLAQGPVRFSPLGPVASAIAGSLGAIPPERAGELRALGVPDDASVGISGLERAFDRRLTGHPGGRLLAGGRVLGSAIPRRGRDVRTTISPRLETEAVAALAGRLGGAIVLDPRSGEVLAAAGIALSGLQPPGSTFKMVTLTGVLENHLAGPGSTFAYATKATLSGVDLQNANGESCGGTLIQSFAQSCNSVFAPLGARLGARRLVATAERFGFNAAPAIPGAATSSIPPANDIGDDLAVGASAIGQGRVQATTLQMAVVAATIAMRGRRPKPTLLLHDHLRPVRAFPARVARIVERLMLAVVNSGTGTTAAIPGVKVAGKTGTAELRSTVPPEGTTGATGPPVPDPTDTDAWFAAYAPAGRPRVTVAVLLVGAGAGRDTAAPAARQLLVAGLKRG